MLRRWSFGLAMVLVVTAAACDDSRSGAAPPTTSPTSSTSSTSSNGSGSPGVCGWNAAAPARYDHIVWIWMENHTDAAVLGRPDTPYETALAAQCGTATDYRVAGSPSLPNYLAATSGDTHGIGDDAGPDSHPLDVDNLFRQVRRAGGSERSYEEDMPSNCALRPASPYAVKHNPAAYYSSAEDRQACATDDVPFDHLATDLDSGALPTFSFVTPNLCNDTHDCGVDVGDAWLTQWVDRIVKSSTYQAGRTALFVVWDEPTPMPFIVVSPTTARVTFSDPTGHYGLLRTTEEMLGLPLLGNAADAASLRDAFHL